MNLKEPPLSSPIREKILWAQQAFTNYRNELLRDFSIRDRAGTLKTQIEASYQGMLDLGIVQICKRCELQEGGSCCGTGLENRYDGVILLINLLLGATLPEERYSKDSCFFLGERGCLLMARHTICINYLCRKITDRIQRNQLNHLREKEGIELNSLFLLHEKVKKKLSLLRDL